MKGESILLVSAFPPDKGRLSEYAAALVNELTHRWGLHVKVLSDSPSSQTALTTVVSAWRPDNVFSMFRLWFKVISAKTRLVHFNLHMAVFGRGRLVNFLGLMTPLIARLAGKKVVVTLHNLPHALRLEAVGIASNMINRLGLWLAASIVARSSHIVVVKMRSYVDIVKRLYGAKEVVWIPHGAWFAESEPVWRWTGAGNVLFLGYIAPYKDLVRLVSALRKIAEKRRVKLLVCGQPHPNFRKEGLELIRLIKDDPLVELIGYVPDGDLPKLLERVDLTVLPYKTSTGTSGVLHLLSALGTPFLAFDTPEFRELAREGAGVLLTSPNLKELAENIEKVLFREDLATELSKRSVKFARSRSWDTVAKAYVRLYSRLM
ncbi:MAG: glycosyltransferase [Candidatus Caldarchaeum sp.]